MIGSISPAVNAGAFVVERSTRLVKVKLAVSDLEQRREEGVHAEMPVK